MHRLAAVAVLTAGVAWLADYFVLPNLWDQLSQPQNLGSLFQRLDGLCLAAIAEDLFFPTAVAYAVQEWMFLIWAGLFAVAQLRTVPKPI